MTILVGMQAKKRRGKTLVKRNKIGGNADTVVQRLTPSPHSSKDEGSNFLPVGLFEWVQVLHLPLTVLALNCRLVQGVTPPSLQDHGSRRPFTPLSAGEAVIEDEWMHQQ